MQFSKLRKRIRIESRSSSQSASGEQSNTWSLVAVVWASIMPLSGRELEKAQAIYAETTHHVLIRYSAGINAQMRVNYEGRFFNIGAVIDDREMHRELTMLCSEGLNDG